MAANHAVLVVNAGGKAEIAVAGPAGDTFFKAEADKKGMLKVALDKKGNPIPVLGPDGKRAREVRVAPRLNGAESVELPKPMAVTDVAGKLVTAIMSEAGVAVEAAVNAQGLLEPVRDTE